eukprot:146307_1
MGKHGQLVMGPAGSGKSTYCNTIRMHCENIGRSVHVVNLDPAAEYFSYPISIDIRDLISIDDVSEELKLGPNGGLVFCMEYLVDNLEWLEEQIANYEDDYLIFDCPGQIELYSHIPVMKRFADALVSWGYNICALYLVDALFMTDPSKFISGTLACLSAMIQMELPHISLLTKCDLLNGKDKEEMEKFLDADMTALVHDLHRTTDPRFHSLNEALGSLVENFSMVSFLPFDITDETCLTVTLQHIDNAIQYGEDLEVKDPLRRTEDMELPKGMHYT